jgi:PAS domain S-box-containing protein
MVLLSYYFVSDVELRHLRKDARNAILYTEANIRSDMMEPETLLGGISETITGMILRGETKEQVNEYFAYINEYVWANSEHHLLGVTGLYGVFDIFGDVMLIGSDIWIPPEDYDLKNRLWYTGAVKAAGEVNITDPYMNAYSNQITMTFSRRIFDKEENPLGIICLNIELNRVMQYAVDTRFAKDGYGFLLSENFMIVAHPEPSLIGTPFREVKSAIASYIDTVMETGSISEVTTTDYRGVLVIVFLDRIYNGWYMGVVTPKGNYFQSTRDLAILLSALGFILAITLIYILMRITREKAISDERMQLMFNSMPLCANIWDEKLNMVDCNENTLKLFGMKDKNEYIDNYAMLAPKLQPDGKTTEEKGPEIMRRVVEDGYYRCEWMHQNLKGDPIPCEITLARVKHRNINLVIAYTRDLREQKQMMKMIERRTHLLDTVNSASTFLLSSNNADTFENSLMKSFALVGYCLDVDRVQIWRNEVLDGDLHFVLRYEWLSEYGRKCKPVPIGLHFPYSMKKDWEEMFMRGEFINAPLCELPEEDQVFLGYYEMKSIVMIPMFLDGYFWGFFSIDDCRKERSFSDEEISILTSAGLMMSSAVNREVQTTKMREADERVQVMFDAVPLAVVFWDKNYHLIDCNHAALAMFDLSSKKEFLDRFFDLSPEHQPDGNLSKQRVYEQLEKAKENGYYRMGWMHQKLNGEPIPAEVILVRVKHKGELAFTGYIRDLREEHARLREMRKAEMAEESSKAKSNFLARMSHEIRTPMNAILGITEIQLQEQSLQEATRDAFERIYNSGDLLLGIINDILDLSKIEAGKLELVPVQYDIASLINDTVQLNIMRYESKPIEFILDVNEDLPLMLIGDELRIKQILNNILSNAFKYTDEGTVTLVVSNEPTEDSENVTLVFSVSDTGQGMTRDQVNKLGSEYARFNMEANRKTEGTGLGMSITMSLVHLMEGELSIDSSPGIGSTFTIRLPQKRTDAETIGRELAENLMHLNLSNVSRIRTVQVKREFMPYGRVLVVDDVETNLYVAKGLLAPYGLAIDLVMSGFEAVDRIREGAVYDIIFMDHMMPRMDGIETTKILRDMGYTQPIVALTANALAGQEDIFLNNGFDEFISKPIDSRQLNATLNKLIRDKKPPEVIEAARSQKNNVFSSGSQVSMYPQLAEFFIRDAKKAAAVLEAIYVNKCRRSDDLSMFIINIHALKSALANIGEPELSDVAAKLEFAGREQNLKSVLGELPSFLESLFDVIYKLEEKNEQEKTAGSDEEVDYALLKEKLLAIQEACAAYEKKSAKAALTELQQKAWPAAVREWLSTISGFLLHSDFDEAANVIVGYVQQISPH